MTTTKEKYLGKLVGKTALITGGKDQAGLLAFHLEGCNGVVMKCIRVVTFRCRHLNYAGPARWYHESVTGRDSDGRRAAEP
jgi:hypothetical protein